MNDDDLLAYALVGLEQEQSKIAEMVVELKSRIGAQSTAPEKIKAQERVGGGQVSGGSVKSGPSERKPAKRKLSAAARKRMADAQRARWAAYRANK